MRRLLSIPRPAAAALPLAVAGTLLVAGCGGDGAEGSGAGPAPTAGQFTERGPSPQTLARRYLSPRLDPWLRYLRYEWGVRPATEWAVLEESVTRWRAQVQLRGDGPSERATAEWLIYLPLGSPSELENKRRPDLEAEIEPADDQARRFEGAPPPVPGTVAQLSGSLDLDDGTLVLSPDTTDRANRTERARRGLQAIGGESNAASSVRIRPGAATRITDPDGDPITAARLRRLADRFLPPATQVTIVWDLGDLVRSRGDLEGNAPESIAVTEAGAP